LYISGVLVNSGSIQFSPGPSGSSGILTDKMDVPFRVGAHRAFTSQAVTNAVGTESGLMAEAFFMDRMMTQAEIQGYAASGFRVNPLGSTDNSNTSDTLKDNIGAIAAGTAPTLSITLWDATEGADPSGYRHTQSGSHPAFIKILSATSGIVFTNARQGIPSDPVAVTVRNMTSGINVSGMVIWLDQYTALNATSGWEVSQRILGPWTPNLSMSSGLGVMGKSLGAASSIKRSDGYAAISGNTIMDASSGEPQISQYVFLAFDTNSDVIPATYGSTGFTFKITADYF
jgi:hypothetical protein